MKLAHIGDMIAIPLFLWLVIYFLRKDKLTDEEKVLAIFAGGGLFADLYFVFIEGQSQKTHEIQVQHT